ncbi:MAG: hypothetical protein H6707_05570 [Deltaproteobacteria bacterium]|nr:hypothetical protein [Deltaproteobacteria bacterium]
MTLLRSIVVLGLASCSAAPAIAEGIAEFRVNSATLLSKSQARVDFTWKYANRNRLALGKGVRFFVFKGSAPGYNNAQTAINGGTVTEIGRLDMTQGGGKHAFSFDLAKSGVAPGETCSLVGYWSNTHRWGCDPSRPGGVFVIPNAVGQTTMP